MDPKLAAKALLDAVKSGERAKEELEDMKAVAESHCSKLREQHAELTSARQRIEELESDRMAACNACDTLKNYISKLEKQLADKQKWMNGASKQMAEAMARAVVLLEQSEAPFYKAVQILKGEQPKKDSIRREFNSVGCPKLPLSPSLLEVGRFLRDKAAWEQLQDFGSEMNAREWAATALVAAAEDIEQSSKQPTGKEVRFSGERGVVLCRGCESPLIGSEVSNGICSGCAEDPALNKAPKPASDPQASADSSQGTAFPVLDIDTRELPTDYRAVQELLSENATLKSKVEEADKRFEFLKSKGLTLGRMKTSDKPEPYLVYVCEPDSEFDDTIHVRKVIDAEQERDRLRSELAEAKKQLAAHEHTDAVALQMTKRLHEVADERDSLKSELARVSSEAEIAKELLRQWKFGGECFCDPALVNTRGICAFCATDEFLHKGADSSLMKGETK